MRVTSLASLAAMTALAVTSCGGVDTAAVVRLGLADNGSTVTLAVGDRLQVILSGGRLIGDWELVSFPRPALAPDKPGPVRSCWCGSSVDRPSTRRDVRVAAASGRQTSPTRWAVTVTIR